MPDGRYLLGIDLGTTGVKSVLLREDGTTVGAATIEMSLAIPRPGWSEQDPAEWWDALCRSVRAALSRTGVRPATITAVGISGQMHGAVLLDRTGLVLRPCILWNDQRSAPQCDEITRRAGGRERLLDLAANPALAGFTAPKLLWVREHEPEIWARVATVLLSKDYLVYRLTGELCTEVSDAAGTLLLDVGHRTWSDEMLALLDLPRSLVPVCHESSAVAGRVSRDAAVACGLAAGTPVVAGGADNACAAIGTGVIAPGRVMSSIGTSGTVLAPTTLPTVDPAGRAHTFCHALPDMWYVMGVMLSAGGALRWFRDVWCQAEVEHARRARRDPYDVLLELAAEVPAGAEGLIFLPYLSGERTPHGDPHARGVFCGLSLRHGTGHLVRAVIEGVTFGLRDALEIICGLALPAGAICATGGGARSPLWRQIQADVCAVPVVAEQAGEGPALGAALLAGAGSGMFTLQRGAGGAYGRCGRATAGSDENLRQGVHAVRSGLSRASGYLPQPGYVRRRRPRHCIAPYRVTDTAHKMRESAMTTNDAYRPTRDDRFTFGLWTVGNRGRDPFGEWVRPAFTPTHIVEKLSELGAWGVNFHDDDLIPFGSAPQERERIIADFKRALDATGLVVPMVTTNLFSHPIFRDGAFTSHDARVRAFALQKVMRNMDLGAELGARIYVFWGGREGSETNAGKDPREALQRMREALNFLAEYNIDQGYGYTFALEPKPNEPRGDLYLPTVGHALAFITTLDHPEMVGVNPEVAHERMAGLDFVHGVAQAIDAGKLVHIDLNDQAPGRYDQDFRFGQSDPRNAFFLVKLLEDSGYSGPKHYDAHALRTEDEEGVWAFAAGCMRTYKILQEKVAQFNGHPEIQGLLAELHERGADGPQPPATYTRTAAETLKNATVDVETIAAHGMGYERLDQLTTEVLLGTR